MARRFLLVSCLCAAGAAAAPGSLADPESALLERWAAAGPDERRHLARELDRIAAARRFIAARPVLVEFKGRLFTLPELFGLFLDPALGTPTGESTANDPGLTEIHRDALAALASLRTAYAPPRPVRVGTLNLLLDYAARSLRAAALPRGVRLRFFAEAARGVREMDGRVVPDARTRWLLHERILPPLLALAREAQEEGAPGERLAAGGASRDAVTEAASLLYVPSLLDDRAQARLAPLTAGIESRAVLVRYFRHGQLDDVGRVALAKGVAVEVRSDPAFAATAPPLLLELLCDPKLPSAERRTLLQVVREGLGSVDLLRPSAQDLLAAGFGGPPRPIEEYDAAFEKYAGGVPLPAGGRSFRFLSVVLLHPVPDAPPNVTRVLRADLPLYEPLATDGRFLGVLVPGEDPARADFLGPAPGLSGGLDTRLVRRGLQGERIAVTWYGPRREEVELCAILPDDGTEPVPARGATLAHVLELLDARLTLTTRATERADLVRLLVRCGTAASRALAVRHGDGPATAAELLPLAERGDGDALRVLLRHAAGLGPGERERAFAAALAAGAPDLRDALLGLCGHADPDIAARAGDAFVAAGDPVGAEALLRHPDPHVRACGAGLALRFSDHAGSLRVAVRGGASLEPLGDLAGSAFPEKGPLAQLGAWARLALKDPRKAEARRRDHKPLYLGERQVVSTEFAGTYAEAIRAGKGEKLWGPLITFLLDPEDPGRGIPPSYLDPLLDALEERALADAALKPVWIDALVALACAEAGMEKGQDLRDLAHGRLARLAGEEAPPEARRKPGLVWPLWAAGKP